MRDQKMKIEQIEHADTKQTIARQILETLPEWFGLEDARESYIRESAGQTFFAAFDAERAVGFLCLKETGRDTLELSVMGVLKAYHRRRIGTALFASGKTFATESGYSFLQVKTVQMGRYEVYDRTNRFYLSLGFKELEVFPTLWDAWNPCQVYILSLQ